MVVEVIEANEIKCIECIKWELDQEKNLKEDPLKTRICQDSELIMSRVEKRTHISKYST